MLQGSKSCGFKLEKHLSLCVVALKLPNIVKAST